MNVTHVLDAPTRTLVSSGEENGENKARITVSWKNDEEMDANIEKAKSMAERIMSDPEFGKHHADNTVRRFVIGRYVFSIGSFEGDYDTWAVHLGRYKVTKGGFARQGKYFILGLGGRRHARALTIEKKKE